MSMHAHDEGVGRRDVLCGGGANVLLAMVTSLLCGSKPLRAQAIAGAVPEVDRLSVRVVIDSYQFAVVPGKKVGPVDVQHFGWGLSGHRPPSKTLISEFGLALHAESQRGGETRNVLMDFGFTPEAMINNAKLLGIDAAQIDALLRRAANEGRDPRPVPA